MQTARALLAIDAATRGAFAWQEAGTVHSEAFHVPAGEHPGARYYAMYAQVLARLYGLRPDAVVYEQSFLRGGASVRVLVGLQTAIQMACAYAQVPVLAVNPSEWRTLIPAEWRPGRVISGDWKALAERLAREQFGAPADLTQDEYDARCMLAWACRYATWRTP